MLWLINSHEYVLLAYQEGKFVIKRRIPVEMFNSPCIEGNNKIYVDGNDCYLNLNNSIACLHLNEQYIGQKALSGLKIRQILASSSSGKELALDLSQKRQFPVIIVTYLFFYLIRVMISRLFILSLSCMPIISFWSKILPSRPFTLEVWSLIHTLCGLGYIVMMAVYWMKRSMFLLSINLCGCLIRCCFYIFCCWEDWFTV